MKVKVNLNSIENLYFEFENRKYFVKYCRMRNNIIFENCYGRWNNATFEKYYWKCVSSRLTILWNNTTLAYKLSISDSGKKLILLAQNFRFYLPYIQISSVLSKLEYKLNYSGYFCLHIRRQFKNAWSTIRKWFVHDSSPNLFDLN